MDSTFTNILRKCPYDLSWLRDTKTGKLEDATGKELMGMFLLAKQHSDHFCSAISSPDTISFVGVSPLPNTEIPPSPFPVSVLSIQQNPSLLIQSSLSACRNSIAQCRGVDYVQFGRFHEGGGDQRETDGVLDQAVEKEIFVY